MSLPLQQQCDNLKFTLFVPVTVRKIAPANINVQCIFFTLKWVIGKYPVIIRLFAFAFLCRVMEKHFGFNKNPVQRPYIMVMLFGIFSRCDSMGEVCDRMRALGR
ncbi:MAG: hypothetical protein LBG45_06915 [Dysgonamonadaceae bacterium]|jgi:hypothetical protein|nr:hypothetical protein [Dysgonamonadaceae bacterium]